MGVNANPLSLERYSTAYFTGTQASIWVGDIWVDECFGIQIEADQSIVPIFGYASATYDAVGRGKVLVRGAFEINFIDEGYLFAILAEAYRRRNGSLPKNITEFRTEADQITPTSTEFVGPPGPRKDLDAITDTLAALKDVQKTREASADRTDRNQQDLQVAMIDVMARIGNLDIAGLDQLGRTLTAPINHETIDSNIIYKVVPFNLTGHFGNPHTEGRAAGTFKEVRDCFLTSNTLIVGSNDDVVKERYEFIGRIHN